MDRARLRRLRNQLCRLEGTACRRCKALHFPPREVCACGSTEVEPHRLSGLGRLYSFTGSGAAKEGRPQAAAFGLVQLEEGGIVFAQLTDLGAEEPSIGQPMQLVIRRLEAGDERGGAVYAYKFRPLRAAVAMEHVA